MKHTARERVLWSIAILVVLLYALIPVAWIVSLSFKGTDELGDGKFFSGFSTRQLRRRSSSGDIFLRRAAQLDRDRRRSRR